MVTQATKAKWGASLLDLYVLLYEENYGVKPLLNRYKEKWNLADVVESVGLDRAKDLLQFYFKTGKQGHPLQFFLYNFERLELSMKEANADAIEKEHLRKITEERVRQFRERRSQGNNGSLPE